MSRAAWCSARASPSAPATCCARAPGSSRASSSPTTRSCSRPFSASQARSSGFAVPSTASTLRPDPGTPSYGLVAGRADAGRFDHDDRGPPRRTGAMHDAPRHRAGLVRAERDRLAAGDVDQQLAVDDEEELVLVVVLVPMELAVDHAEADRGIVDASERLVEPRLVRGRFGRNVDQLEVAEGLPLGQLDVVDPAVALGEHGLGFGLDDGSVERVAREGADRVRDVQRVTTTISMRAPSSSTRSSVASTKPAVPSSLGRTVLSKCPK